MKKIILFLLLICPSLFAQSVWWVDTTANGAERRVYLGDYTTVKNKGGANFAGMPVRIISQVDDPILLSYLHPATKNNSNNALTVTTETDTVVFTNTTTWAIFSIYSVNDTLEYSLAGDFTKPSRVMPGQPSSTGFISAISYPKAYIRRKGTEGTPIYDYSWIGY